MPHRYPQEGSLRDGRRVLIRPFKETDADELYNFFQRLTPEDRRFAWHRIDDRAVVDNWALNIDFGKAFPLVATDGSRIVADATLHRIESGPLRRVGRVKWLIDPAFRRCGLGTLLMNHFIDVARENGLRHLTCMLISDVEADAVRVLEHLGFKAHIIPEYGTDPDGYQHDMTHLVLKL
jgi:acetyltransferase